MPPPFFVTMNHSRQRVERRHDAATRESPLSQRLRLRRRPGRSAITA